MQSMLGDGVKIKVRMLGISLNNFRSLMSLICDVIMQFSFIYSL